MMLRTWLILAIAGGLLIPGGGLAAQVVPAIPDVVLAQTAVPMTEAAIDSACAARALPLAGAAIFGGLVNAVSRARAAEPAPPMSAGAATARAVSITAGWYAVMLFIGIAVLIFAGDRLRQVSRALETDAVGSLVTGLLAGLASIPLLLLVTVVLALTILGVLLIPFAIVALVLAYTGLAVLGLLAVASVAGRAVLGRRRATMTERAASLGGMIVGLSLLLAAWFIAALFTWSPEAGLVLRSMALGLTAVAITAGAGAVIRSFRRSDADRELLPAPREEELSWQTPTPVGGVVAVRRSAS